MNPKAATWLLSRDTGLSSRFMLAFFEGANIQGGRVDYPLDPSDFGRCLRLLEAVPEYKPRLLELTTASPEWVQLVTHWDEIEALYRGDSWRKCYDRMQALIREGRTQS